MDRLPPEAQLAGSAAAPMGPTHWLAGAFLLIPWLEPFAPGPSSNVVPWLASAACALLVLALSPAAAVPRRWLLVAIVASLFVLLRPVPAWLDRTALAGALALILAGFAIGRGNGERERTVALVAAAWLLAALLSSAIALLQYFDFAQNFQPWAYAAKAGDAVGNLRQRNQFATLTTVGLAALLWFAAKGRGRLPLWLAGVALLATANAATTSRTGLLEWVVVLGLAATWTGPARRRGVGLCVAGLAGYGIATLALPVLLEHATGLSADSLMGRLEADIGCSSRRVLWGDVLRLIGQRPLAGWGWGELDYAHYLHLYGDAPRFCDILDNAHNLPLHVAVELGVPAALLLCAAVVAGLWRARPWREGSDDRRLAWCVLSALALHSLLEYPLWYGPFQLALGLAFGLLAGPGVLLAPRLRTGLAAAGLALVAYAGWDYERVSQVYLEPEARWSWWREDTLGAAQRSWLFASQARFAELTLTPVTRANADWVAATAEALLHYSPEPRVIERVIEAETMQGRYDEAVLDLARYRAAFPADYEKWRAAQKRPIVAPQ